ncbi:LuxR family transcriptional regulator [Mycolicibacterium cosmeticum]|uniref:Response regulator containing a CheY-like receiver domain and an HTH DNA-binding domain protein n=1 Tax=Mycolicibacterium cosmeticum TaxID=258533 RepID=W9AIQ2_MYCCO|nr:LuxR family transcriptional regulator [Mycolicibacterium cosmeticum]TLH68821.1 LuxR family transcriptional regulator [Mycolicibacterium cosmeticum]CDO05569.1 response regulator containing a CheY-like receiver domain and an HTH DNA-binding domain protein [Mycolicibacterium cosmeticum]
MRLTWPLTGRSAEIGAVRAGVSARDTAGVVVCGPAGVGKSRLVRDALQGSECRWIVGTTSARDIPLGAFTAWTRSADDDRLRLVHSVIDAVTAAPPGRGVIVAVDDAHLLDDLSVFVLHQIVQWGAAKVVLTVRDGSDGSGIPESVRELWKDKDNRAFARLDLQPLARQESADLLAAALNGPVDPDAAARLWTLTRGNVLYLRNIVEQELADGRLQQHAGCWQWVGEPVLPSSLVELIDSRFGDLPPAVATVVDVLAVGEPIELATLQRITDRESVEEANIRGLITVDPCDSGMQARVAHPLYGEIRRVRAPSTTLRRLRGLVATELAAGPDRDELRVVVRRASLSLDSDLPPDADLLVHAARGAIWLADLQLAGRLAEAAIAGGAGADAHFLHAHALSWSFRGAEAERALAELITRPWDDLDRARFTYLRATNLLWALSRPDEAKALVDAVSVGPDGRSWIDAFLVIYWFATDRPAAALEAAKAINLPDLPGVVGAETAFALTVVTADAGRTSDALKTAETGYAAAMRGHDAPHMRFNIADAELGALLLAGRLADVEPLAERVRAQSAELPGAAHALGAAIAGRAALGTGRLHDACGLLDQAAVAFAAHHSTGWGYRYNVVRATALAMHGQVTEAAAILDEIDALARPFRSLSYERSIGRAWVAAGQGVVSEAVGILAVAAETAAANGQFAAEVMCLQVATQFGSHEHADRLAELAGLTEGPRSGLAARFAAALRDEDAQELAAVSEAFEAMGDLAAAMDAAAHAAICHRGRGRRGSALNCSVRAEALAEHTGVITPALEQAAEPLPLTERECEVVALIAAELLNKEIAERLHLSARTVEGHVYRAMHKTGTSSREELAELWRRRRRRPQ